MAKSSDLLQGTLDMLMLLRGRLAGPVAQLRRAAAHPADFRRTAGDRAGARCVPRCTTGASGPHPQRWGESDNKRKAKYYQLAAAGRRRFQEETRNWARMADIIAAVLDTSPEEL